MPDHPDINRILSQHPRRKGFTNDAGEFVCTGSHMGSPDIVDDDCLGEPLRLQALAMVDGDYAADGTYWGGPGPNGRMYCAFNSLGARIFVRALTRLGAIHIIAKQYPHVKILRHGRKPPTQ